MQNLRHIAVALLFVGVGPAMAESHKADPVAERSAAMKYCGGCHAVSENQGRATTDAAPTFLTLSRDPTITEESLRAFLRTPHSRMPSVTLSAQERDHVIAYILRMRLNN
jgi:mono/diheme cytochrome c family protein